MGMDWSWFERAKQSETNWVERVTDAGSRPGFEDIASSAADVRDSPGSRLAVTTYDPYTGVTYTSNVRVDAVDDSTVVGADGRSRIFVLPDLTADYFNTQGGTDRMPDLIIDYDVIES